LELGATSLAGATAATDLVLQVIQVGVSIGVRLFGPLKNVYATASGMPNELGSIPAAAAASAFTTTLVVRLCDFRLGVTGGEAVKYRRSVGGVEWRGGCVSIGRRHHAMTAERIPCFFA